MTVKVEDLTYIPFDEATTPREGGVRLRRWCIVHPEKGLAIWRGFSLQCSSHRSILESLLEHYPDHEIRHFDAIYEGTRNNCF